MGEKVYSTIVRLPFKIGSGVGWFAGLAAAGWPEEVAKRTGEVIDGSTIQSAGIGLLALSSVYFASLWFFKPSTQGGALPVSVDLGLDRIRDDIKALQDRIETLATKDNLETMKAELSKEIETLTRGLEEEAGHRNFLARNARMATHCTVAADQFSDCRPQITSIVEELCDDLYMLDDADTALGWNQRHRRIGHLEQQLWDVAGGDQELNDIITAFTIPHDNEAQEFADIGVPAHYSDKAAEVMRKALTIDAFFDNTIARLRRKAARAVLEIDGN